jgi:hypothetical protein
MERNPIVEHIATELALSGLVQRDADGTLTHVTTIDGVQRTFMVEIKAHDVTEDA